MYLMGIDHIEASSLCLKGRIFKVASYLSFNKQEQLHCLVPMGRCIRAHILFNINTKSGFVHIRQSNMLVFSHKTLHFSNYLSSHFVHKVNIFLTKVNYTTFFLAVKVL